MWQAVGKSPQWDQLISSPLRRCWFFTAALANRQALPLAIEPEFCEIGMGVWEGYSDTAIQVRDAEYFAAFKHDPVAGRRILIVCHAGVIRALLGSVLGAQPERWYRLQIEHASLSQIRVNQFGVMGIAIQMNRKQLKYLLVTKLQLRDPPALVIVSISR